MTKLLHNSIRLQAECDPDRIAFRCREDSITYGEFLERTHQLANVLLTLGVHPSERVGIYLSKRLEMPIAAYGILAAGCAYVPIDPTAPVERVEFILRDCGIRTLITHQDKIRSIRQLNPKNVPLENIVGLPKLESSSWNCLSWEELLQAEVATPKSNPSENDLAYIMYTSGSTGTPKGLMHTHSSGLAYARFSASLYSVNKHDILGNHAPLHFDISTFEFLTGPYAGATSVLIPEEATLFPSSLAELIERERLSFWYSVPRALIQLLERGDLASRDLSSLRWVMFGGEPFPPKYLRSIMDLIPNARFCNVYGPAEVNQCSYFHLPKNFDPDSGPVPLGKIWEGAQYLILDEQDQSVEQGSTGALHVHSSTMMQAYWNRDDLNDKAFYRHTSEFGIEQRYYRTGDLVREAESGLLEFCGRKDRQVKIRGFRLELDEVEAVFVEQENVEEAVALIVPDQLGDPSLLVIIKPIQGSAFDKKQSLLQARRKLPSYGVPACLELRQDFPHTTSGKVDRNTLSKEYESPLATR